MHIILPVLMFVALGTPDLGPGDHIRTVTVQKRERSAIVHVPPSYDRMRPTPVVLVYHGASMNAKSMTYLTNLNETADKEGFIAVYPNGTGIGDFLVWNAGGQTLNVADDVAFTGRLLDDLESVLRVDKKRVYACGMSNGGMMCYRLAAELSDRIAAIAPVSGTNCVVDIKPKRPVPIVHFHGTDDFLVPMDGPNKNLPLLIHFQSLDSTIRTWLKCNRCKDTPDMKDLPNIAADKLAVTRKHYAADKSGAEVVVYTIDGGGHTWPGMARHAPFLGKTTFNISANDVMWDFFKKHTLK
jgi:polyhydroxybutyrate depolymerase